MLDSMIEHLYSPLMSDLIVRLLNFNKSVLKTQSDLYSDTINSPEFKLPNEEDKDEISETQASEVRAATVFSIIERLGAGYTFDQ